MDKCNNPQILNKICSKYRVSIKFPVYKSGKTYDDSYHLQYMPVRNKKNHFPGSVMIH